MKRVTLTDVYDDNGDMLRIEAHDLEGVSIMKYFLVFVWLFFLAHIAAALAGDDGILIINQPNGGQTVCITQGSYVVCY